jgi:hypothetical protein
MKNIHAVLLALLNLVAIGISGGVALGMAWKEWWHPLLMIGASATIASSLVLWFLEKQYGEESPERSRIAWSGNILFIAGIGLAIAVLSATGSINL